MAAAQAEIGLTVLIPVYNEAGNILPLAEEVAAALDAIPHEILFVDDGSDDTTPDELKALHSMAKTVRVIRHKTRAGKSAALVTGFRAARAPWVQTLDGDRQNDPADVARLWCALHRPAPPMHLGLVAGVRKRRNDGWVKWLSSRIANDARRALLNDATPDTACGFKLIRREVAIELPYFDGMHRFLPALTKRAGYEVMQFPVEDRPRALGKSKYGFFGRLGAGLFDLFGVFWLIWRSRHVESEERE